MKNFVSLLTAFFITSTSLPAFAAANCNQVLVVLSSSQVISTKEGGKHPTGYFLPELTGPVAALLKAGYEVVIANPDGNVVEMDKISDDPRWFKDEASYQAAKQLVRDLPGLKSPRKLSSFTESDLKSFAGLFVPGGHAPMEDLAENRHMGLILKFFHENGKPTALICHGPAALLSTKTWRSEWIYNGYKMTAFSTVEEKEEEDGGVFNGHLLFYLENELAKSGGLTQVAKSWTSSAVRDRELITGQNPMSEEAFSALLLEALTEYRLKDKAINQIDPLKGDRIEDGKLYDVLRQPVDWNAGHRTFFVGTRKADIPENEFLPRMQKHVREVIAAFKDKGLIGYVMSVSGNSEVAYQMWTSRSAMEAAFSTDEGKAIVQDATSFMTMDVFKDMHSTPAWLK